MSLKFTLGVVGFPVTAFYCLYTEVLPTANEILNWIWLMASY